MGGREGGIYGKAGREGDVADPRATHKDSLKTVWITFVMRDGRRFYLPVYYKLYNKLQPYSHVRSAHD